MLISELARRTGVSVHALRHYERLGLIAPRRRANGYRDYPETMKREVVFIAMARQIGFGLPEIAGILPQYRARRLSIDELLAHMQARVDEIDRQTAALQAQRRTVTEHMGWVRAQRRARPKVSNPAPGAAKPWPAIRRRKEKP